VGHSGTSRYGDIAIIFHWLIAIFIIGLLAIGKFMTGLDQNDPLRFELTQWHKSFGITVLLLSVMRLAWRWLNSPPKDPDSLPRWQQLLAHSVHIALYALMFGLPLSGWLMVSASPLNIDTILFNVISWPHLPIPESFNKELLTHNLERIHDYASMVMMTLLLAHMGAALKHHFVDRDVILSRMLPPFGSRIFTFKAILATLLISFLALSFYWIANNRNKAVFAAGSSEVGFTAQVTGDETDGKFTDSSVIANLDLKNLSKSKVSARVQTASVISDNLQVSGALTNREWFDPDTYPEAIFESSQIELISDSQLRVTGNLTIKEGSKTIQFELFLKKSGENQLANGSFEIDRRQFNLGMDSQESDEYVGFLVTITFSFEIIISDGT